MHICACVHIQINMVYLKNLEKHTGEHKRRQIKGETMFFSGKTILKICQL